jgi:hypothetical protein
MKVHELIEQLLKLPGDLPIRIGKDELSAADGESLWEIGGIAMVWDTDKHSKGCAVLEVGEDV